MRELRARHRLCLTGTPMENHLGELWSLLHFLMPGLLGRRKAFPPPVPHADRKARRCGSPRPAAAAHRARSCCAARKQEVAKELPPKTEIVPACRTRQRAARSVRKPAPGHAQQDPGGDRQERHGAQPHHHSRRAAQAASGVLRSATGETRFRPQGKEFRETGIAHGHAAGDWWRKDGVFCCSRSSPACWR